MPLSASLNVGVSALKTFAEGIQVTSNNISNVNTVGYKVSRAQYSDTFSNLLKPMVPNTTNTGAKVPPTQIGGGVQIESVQAVFSQGTIQTSANNSDLGIAGAGFFVVKDPLSGKTMATRSGNFRLDADGFLVTQQGHRVQGAYGATTVVQYDASNGETSVQSVNNNLKLSALSLTSNNPVIPVTSTTKLAIGMVVSGPGIPYGAKIVNKTDTTITLSSAPSVTTGDPAKNAGSIEIEAGSLFADIVQADISTFSPGFPIVADGIPVGTRVVGVNVGTADLPSFPVTLSTTGAPGGVSQFSGTPTKGVGYITLAAGTGYPANSSAAAASGATTLTFAANDPAAANWASGMAISGTGIEPGTRIKTWDIATGILTLSRPTTAVVPLNAQITAKESNIEKLSVGMKVEGSMGGTPPVSPQIYRITKIEGDQITFDQDLVANHTQFVFTPTLTLSDSATDSKTILANQLNYIPDKNKSFASLSFGNKYKPALLVGDVRISFDEGADKDYTFVDTNGAALSGLNLANARSKVPQLRSFNVGTSGEISVILSNGQTFNAGYVLLQSFKDPGALIREGSNMFSGLDTAGRFNGEFTADNIQKLIPGMAGLGVINGGSLELSNVDLGEEFSNMIITQRAFQAGSRIISTTDSMMEEVVNLKR
jgi:flagellar hook protein FlgE